ncbi:MAG: efflux RND transporter periplasmic adaptor subunit, partial [Oscillospiraceae bacterium]
MAKNKGKKSIVITIIVIGAILISGACFILFRMGNKVEESPNFKQREYTASTGNITVGVEAAGKISFQNIPYFLPKEVTVEKIFVKPGMVVKKGDPLVQLSTEEAKKNYDFHKARYEKKQENLGELEEEKQEYLLGLSWASENEQEEQEEKYDTRHERIEGEISALEEELSNAQWKKDYWEDEPLVNASIMELEKNIEQKQNELEQLEKSREEEIAEESNPQVQRERQAAKIADFEEKAIALKKEIEEARKEMEAAESPLIVSENDGIVQKINLAAGQSSDGEKPVIEVGNQQKITLKFTIDPENIVDVKEGQNVDFFVDAYPDQILTGTVKERVLVPDTEGKFGALVQVNP